MKIYKSIQKWDYHVAWKYMYFQDDDYVGGFTINFNPHSITFDSLWIEEKYRGKGIANIMMKEIMSLNIPDLSCMVHKDNFVIKLYEKYGFTFWYNEDEYIWMINVD